VLRQSQQKPLVKFKTVRKLGGKLPHGIQELDEDGTSFMLMVASETVARPLSEFVPKLNPLLFYQYSKA